MSDKWDIRFLELARHISGWSKDPSTKVGCVVVGEDTAATTCGSPDPEGERETDGEGA